ncbi:MAG: galactose mutarotase [Chitinophagaceae bacterium]|jgi:aldose 1-epimerase|nr:galactose mutarotase [Chitinophagaceae bacterium]
MKLFYLFSATAVMLTACSGSSSNTEKDSSKKDSAQYTLADKKDFTQTIDAKPVGLYVLKNQGIEATITNYGGRLVNLLVPDKNGNPTDVIVGPGTLQQFIDSKEPYYGATIGRYGNRIAKGKFTLDGKTYTLAINNAPNSLHGGKKGFQYVIWNAEQPSDSVLTLSYLSKDGEEGFPGNLNVKVSYTLTKDTTMRIDYEATTDKPTVCNLTNHAYYNLNGYNAGTAMNHILQMYANSYTPVDSTLIPFGKIEPVAGTPLDFTTPQSIGARVNDTNNIQIKNGKGYDHNYVLNQNAGNALQKAATVKGDKSGIVLTIFTQEPGLQFYSGNFMHGKNAMKGNSNDEYRAAIALEPQHFPDSPNQPQFPSTELKLGETYKTTSIYKFSVEK